MYGDNKFDLSTDMSIIYLTNEIIISIERFRNSLL